MNRTVVDDIFRWGPEYGRAPPVFQMVSPHTDHLPNAAIIVPYVSLTVIIVPLQTQHDRQHNCRNLDRHVYPDEVQLHGPARLHAVLVAVLGVVGMLNAAGCDGPIGWADDGAL